MAFLDTGGGFLGLSDYINKSLADVINADERIGRNELMQYGQGLLEQFSRPQPVPYGQPTMLAGQPGTVGGVPRSQLPAIGPSMQQVNQSVGPQMQGMEAGGPQPQPQGPGMGDRFMAGLQSALGVPHPLMMPGLFLGGMMSGKRQDPIGMQVEAGNEATAAEQQRRLGIAQYLASRGVPAADIAAAINNPDIGKALPEALIKKQLEGTKPDGTFKFQGMEFPYKVENGKMNFFMPGGGGPVPANMQDMIRQQQHFEAESKGMEEAAKTEAKLRADARVALGGAKIDANTAIKQARDLLAHPGLKNAVGKIGADKEGLYVAGSPEWAFKNREAQLKGQAFRMAYETLKGGGQITEYESKTAAAALHRISTTLDEKEYRAAIEDFITAVENGYRKLQDRAHGKPGNDPVGGPVKWDSYFR